MTSIRLPESGGGLGKYSLSTRERVHKRTDVVFNRVAYAAVHVVPDPLADNDPFIGSAIDWDTTLAYRRHLWGMGLGVAEAMDTAQRGMGLDWPTSLELIRRSVAEARTFNGNAMIACGVGTDHLPAEAALTLEDVARAYEEQCEAIEYAGGRIILMCSRALAAVARSADDYRTVYRRILEQVREPVILHWLGDMFDPALVGYWGSGDLDEAMTACLEVVAENAAKVDGIKLSLLDAGREIDMRRRLPAGVRMYTGDDFNYPDLIAGDEHGYSDALLGIFDPIAPAASAALGALADGDHAAYEALFAPTVPLARHVFAAPTRFYKTGVVFMAYLNGFQSHFTMVGGQQSARSLLHLADIFRLADGAGLLLDQQRAVARMRHVLALHGVEN